MIPSTVSADKGPGPNSRLEVAQAIQKLQCSINDSINVMLTEMRNIESATVLELDITTNVVFTTSLKNYSVFAKVKGYYSVFAKVIGH